MLNQILSIAGKPGLYKLVSQGKNMLIVESLSDQKRMPTYARDKIVSLADVSMYTTGEDVALSEVLTKLGEKQSLKPVDMDLKNASADMLRTFFEDLDRWRSESSCYGILSTIEDQQYDDLFKGTDADVYIPMWASACKGHGDILIDTPEGRRKIARKAAALVRPVVDMEGIEEVDLSGEAEPDRDDMVSFSHRIYLRFFVIWGLRFGLKGVWVLPPSGGRG